ncbi:hypothetical protein GXW71_21255 [Roseomonas hellenica]|uniref:Uncharacterized protein n=1 Tax=Plastoroseomonas hellenica TaxID=2687306 RepID=A0ABS5F2T4_9PROT|nr:hypothetical protein [Plastoroseomonas hellenica]MBR0666903.1 hypothetical protein [Plastoroseomonas hellenica]
MMPGEERYRVAPANPVEPESPPVAPAPSPLMKVLAALGLILLLLLPFGSLGLLVAGIVGWFLWSELAELSAVLLAVALFLMSGAGGIAARFWAALGWGGAAAVAAAILLLPFTATDGPVTQGMDRLAPLALAANLAWLALIALAAWRFHLPERVLGPLLALVVLTSRLVAYPALVIQAVVTNLVTDTVQGIVFAPIALAGIAIGMLAALSLGAVLAWAADAGQRWIAPRTTIALLAVAALLLRLGVMIAA